MTQKSWFRRNRFCRVTPAQFIRYLNSFYKANLDINKPLRLWVFIYTLLKFRTFGSAPFLKNWGRYIIIINHIGIYGICIRDNKVLCIQKERDPYKNRFDLPGGSQKENEGLIETLVREFREETRYQIKGYGDYRVYDVFVEESNRIVHHIMVFYDVDINLEQQDTISEKLEDELNDSSGIYWIDLEKLDIKNSSPLILKLKQELSNDKNTLEKVIYKNWEIL